jgi:acetyltransferase-like isoleucine patch superfamily enzyme
MRLSKHSKNLIVRLINKGLWTTFQWRLTLAYRIWGINAIHKYLLLCDPSYVGRILTKFGATLGADYDLYSPLLIHNAEEDYSNLKVGEHCHIGREVFLDLGASILIENYVTISMRVMILTHMDVGKSPLKNKEFPTHKSPIVIKKGAYIGAGAIILQGVTIGECAVVGAGALVSRDIPANTVAVGIPARVVRQLGN